MNLKWFQSSSFRTDLKAFKVVEVTVESDRLLHWSITLIENEGNLWYPALFPENEWPLVVFESTSTFFSLKVPVSSILLKYKYLSYLLNTSFYLVYSVLVSLFTSVIPVFPLTCEKNHFIDVCNIIVEHMISIKTKHRLKHSNIYCMTNDM